MPWRLRRIHYYGLAWLILVLDQVTKLLVEKNFPAPGTSRVILEPLQLIRLTYVTNRGAAWGILQGFQLLFILVALVVAGVCVWILETRREVLLRLSAALVLGGGLGNLMDRLFLSTGVVDFLDVGIYQYRWPTFNVADMMLSVGVVLLIYRLVGTDAEGILK